MKNNWIQVGDIVSRSPKSLGNPESVTQAGTPRQRQGKVVYVHPRGRYHVVEFSTELGPVRESFVGVEREDRDLAEWKARRGLYKKDYYDSHKEKDAPHMRPANTGGKGTARLNYGKKY